GYQLTVDDECGADASAERGHQDHAVTAMGSAITELSKACRVRVVEHVHVVTGVFAHNVPQVGVDPGIVDARCGLDHAALHHAWERDADGHVVSGRELGDAVGHGAAHRVRRGRVGGGDPVALFRELSGTQVDGRGLD